MKKAMMLLIGVIVLLSLGGCMRRGGQLTKLIGSEQQMSDQIMETIVEALDAGDVNTLKELFSESALEDAEDIDQQIANLMEFYQGEMVSYVGDASSSTSNNYGVKATEFTGRYQLITTEENYRARYEHKPVDDENPEEIGLRKLEFVTEEIYQKEVEIVGYYQWQHIDDEPGVYLPE